MQALTPLFLQTEPVPAWWGKLPGMGDFAARRLEGSHFVDEWDRWLQSGFAQLRGNSPDWVAPYLASPVWLFALGVDVVDDTNCIGILMPSVDAVGRYFPLTVVSKLSRAARCDEVQRECAQWWWRATHVALQALEADMDAQAFEAALQACFAQPLPEGGVSLAELPQLVWPLQGECVCLPDPWGQAEREQVRCFGLPRGERFAQLFGQPTVAHRHQGSEP